MPQLTPADRPATGVPLAANPRGKAKGLGLPDYAFGNLLEGGADLSALRPDDPAQTDVGPRPESLSCAALILPLPSAPAMPDPAAPGEGGSAEVLIRTSPLPDRGALVTSDQAPSDPPASEPPAARINVVGNAVSLGPELAAKVPAEPADSACVVGPAASADPPPAGSQLPAAPAALAAAAAFGPALVAGHTQRVARDPAPAATPESARGAELANGGVPAPGLAEISPRNVPDVPKGETSGAMVVPSSPVPDKPEDQTASSPVSGAAGSPQMPMQAFLAEGGADQRQQRGRGDTESLGGIAEVVAPTARGPAVEVQAVPLSPRPGVAEPPATPVHVSRQLAEAAGAQRDGMVEVALAPEELGRVKLRLQAHDGVMSVSIQAERPETLDLMRRHADLLARDFRDLGFRDVAFSFAEHSGQRSAPPPDPDEGMELAPTIDPVRPLAIPPKPSAAGRGLDLRM